MAVTGLCVWGREAAGYLAGLGSAVRGLQVLPGEVGETCRNVEVFWRVEDRNFKLVFNSLAKPQQRSSLSLESLT